MAIDLNKAGFIGHYIEFFDIDGLAIGLPDAPHLHFAPQVDYDDTTGVTSAFVFEGQTYQPLPCQLSKVKSSSVGAPPTPTLTVSNINKTLFADVLAYSGLVGATVTRHRTFSENVATSDELPIQTFIISQITNMSKAEIQFKLNVPIDFEGTKLPLRTVLKDNGFPGVARSGTRNG